MIILFYVEKLYIEVQSLSCERMTRDRESDIFAIYCFYSDSSFWGSSSRTDHDIFSYKRTCSILYIEGHSCCCEGFYCKFHLCWFLICIESILLCRYSYYELFPIEWIFFIIDRKSDIFSVYFCHFCCDTLTTSKSFSYSEIISFFSHSTFLYRLRDSITESCLIYGDSEARTDTVLLDILIDGSTLTISIFWKDFYSLLLSFFHTCDSFLESWDDRVGSKYELKGFIRSTGGVESI